MVRHVSRLAATARNSHYFSRRTPLNFFAAFFAPGFSQMDSPVALLRFVQADARKVVLSRREDTRLDQGNAKRGRSQRGHCQTAKDALAKGGGVFLRTGTLR